jgi:cholesterol transport system auxiliary component
MRWQSPLVAIITGVATSLLLVGCFSNAARQATPARFDFGAAPADAPALGVVAVEVGAPSWLSDSAMQYRLSYLEPTRRFDYADSRWAAPPAELLGQVLERRLAGPAVDRCRLHIELDEVIQDFESAQTSHILLAGRAILLAGPESLARRKFSFTQPAPTADARGGVAAAASVVKALGDDLASWIAQVDRCR